MRKGKIKKYITRKYNHFPRHPSRGPFDREDEEPLLVHFRAEKKGN